MKNSLICLIFAAFAAVALCHNKEEFQRTSKLCMDELKINEADIKKFVESGFDAALATDSIKCHMKCMMEKQGIFKNGVYDDKAALKSLMEIPQLKEHKAEVEKTVNECKTEKAANDCETAFKISMCFKAHKAQAEM